MRVLVTGASGGLAPCVLRALWERHEVVLLSRRPPQAARATLPWVQGDVTVCADCHRAVQGIDAMQHLAPQPWPVDHSRLRGQATAQGVPCDATFQRTMLGTYDLMQAAGAAGVEQVIMAGSHSALGQVAGVVAYAPPTYGAQMAGQLAPRPLLVVHGKADTRLLYACGVHIDDWAQEPQQLVLYDGAEHRLDACAAALEQLLTQWIPTTLRSAGPAEQERPS